MPDSRKFAFEGATPDLHPESAVSREATLVGDVVVDADASVWPGVVLRGDVAPVRVGRASHVGDNAVLHASEVGSRVMVGHGAVLDDATVADGALVGFNATVNTGVSIGEESIVAAGTVVPEAYEIPARSFARGVPARVSPLAETDVDPGATFERYSSGAYTDLAGRHDDLFG
jgi:carbonic anhydrase/acetyltransferase-like protein (isoleucine patch superfamily)